MKGRDRRDPDPFLTVRAATKRFGHVVALSNVDFHVSRGEVVALAGENGSGKSTLARIIAGALRLDDGEMTLDGAPLRLARPRDGFDARIALVGQEPSPVPDVSVAENVLMHDFSASLRLVRRRELSARAQPILAAVGLDVHPLRLLRSLSPVERELVEIAKALAADPRLLILDEATARLSDASRLFAVVDDLRRRGVATVLITHRLREIADHADRVVVLRDGRRVGELRRDEITGEGLSAMMVGRALSEFFHKQVSVPGDPVLRADAIRLTPAAPPVSLEVRAGEILGLAGLVGAGRTELLEALAGARSRHSGRVSVDGVAVRAGSIQAATRAGIKLVPEDRIRQGLVRGRSVRENIEMSTMRAFGLADARRQREHAERAVEELRIRTASVDADVATLSGGNQQKVVIARALAGVPPRVLLLDEPTLGVDVGAKEEIYRVIGGIVRRGTAVLVASSDLLEILGICDRIVVLFEGSVAGELDRPAASEERIALLSAGGSEVA